MTSSRFRDWYGSRLIRPELMGIVGFDIWRCWPDAMHCLDLGVYKYVAASCLVELVGEGVWHRTDDAGYKAAHLDYKLWCQLRNLPPCPLFDKTKLVASSDQYPVFSQQQAKASMTRYIMLWLREVLERPGVSAGTHGSVRLAMMVAVSEFEEILQRNDRWLVAADKALAADHMETALVHMNLLCNEAVEKDIFRWHLTPKSHMAAHLAYDFAADGVNPRRVTCYAEGDMVGRMKRIISKCHGKTAGRTCLDRYAILVGTRWWTRLAFLRGLRQ